MSSQSTPRRVGAATIAVVALLGLTACTGDGTKKNASDPAAPVTSTPATSGRAKAVPARVNPLRGGKASGNGVVGVKIDDTANGRPQRNIDQADIVYIEEVEGGLTRLLAVFSTHLPSVESVRSTRAADPEIAAQFGSIAYAASGGAHNPLHLLDQSPLKTSINDRGGPGFRRDPNRPAPYNLQAALNAIAKAKKAPRAKSIGYSWSASTAQLKGTAGGTRVRTVVGGTPVRFDYNRKTKLYERFIDGVRQRTAAGRVIATPNVIVQFCRVTLYPQDRDVLGNPNMFTHTVGKGKIVVFRDGRRVPGTWSRPTAKSATTMRDAKGRAIPLRPGGAWVVLTKTSAALG